MTEIVTKQNIHEEVNAKEFIREYWTGRSRDFAKLRRDELHCEKYKRWENQIVCWLPEKEHLRILDVGCGSGFFTILMAKLGYEAVGVDLTESMIMQGKILSSEEKVAPEFFVMDAEHLDFEDESFDVILSRNLTWNLPHPEEAYKEWLRVLKPGGIIQNYDGEYAKDHHRHIPLPPENAHNKLTEEENEHCHQIYHMLDISMQSRPAWDIQTLQKLEVDTCEIDFHVGERIYREQDEFYVPTPIFGIRVVK